MTEAALDFALRAFAGGARPLTAERYGSGHINLTYLATYLDAAGGTVRRILQRINPHVLPDPEAVVENISLVTTHLCARLAARGLTDLERRVLALQPALGGGCLVRDPEGGAWRAYAAIEQAQSVDQVSSPSEAFEAARAFGEFQRLLADYDGPPLADTVPGFHHTPLRMRRFAEVLAQDPCQRARGSAPEIDVISRHGELAASLTDPLERGEVPLRIVHNDTKINNVLFDRVTGEGLCVIDLDTVSVGTGLADFGDLVRTATCRAPEDETDLARIEVDRELLGAVAAGFQQGVGDLLTARERELLVTAGMVITFEVGLRFLTDYLEGDRYFRIHRPHHNLERCRSQFALLAALERDERDLRRLVHRS